MFTRTRFQTLLVSSLLTLAAAATLAQAQVDPPGVVPVGAGHARVTLTVTAGATGAPQGFTLWWMTRQAFEQHGNQWPADPVAEQGTASFTGEPTLNTADGAYSSFELGPDASIAIEIGDLFDETGLEGNADAELDYATEYVFCAYANGVSPGLESALSVTVSSQTTSSNNCTATQGYWKNHGPVPSGNNQNVWPVLSLTLGSVTYNQNQLQSIFETPARGNGLISLAHQLIAAKLNIASGADPTAAIASIQLADALIGARVVPPVGSGSLAPSSASPLTQALDNYNNGVVGPGHCAAVPVNAATWGRLKAHYR